MKTAFLKFDKLVSHISQIFLYISAVAIFLMSLLCFCDVFMRYFFNSPIHGGQEMVTCFMAIFVFCGMGMATRRYRLTRVPLFLDMMKPAAKSFVEAVGSLLCCACSALFCRQLALSAIRYSKKLSVTVQTIEIPIWPLYAIAAVSCGLMALEMLLRCIKEIGAGCAAAKAPHATSDTEVTNG